MAGSPVVFPRPFIYAQAQGVSSTQPQCKAQSLRKDSPALGETPLPYRALTQSLWTFPEQLGDSRRISQAPHLPLIVTRLRY